MKIDLSPRAFRVHTAQQLASTPALRNSVLQHLFNCLSHRCMVALGGANLRFAYVPGDQPFLIVGYDRAPIISQPLYWQELEELCWEVVFTTGITQVQIVGRHASCRCWLNAHNRWVKKAHDPTHAP